MTSNSQGGGGFGTTLAGCGSLIVVCISGVGLLSSLIDYVGFMGEIKRAVDSTTDKNRLETRIMLVESRKQFSANGDEVSSSARDDFCEDQGFDKAYSYSSRSITCEFEHNTVED